MQTSVKIGVALGLGLIVLFLSYSIARDWSPTDVRVADGVDLAAPDPTAVDALTEHRIAMFCGDCHALPNPANFPRDRWHHEVKKGYEFYARSGRMDLDPPPLNLTLQYYLSRAPEEPSFPQPVEASQPLKSEFQVEKRYVGEAGTLPEISSLLWTPVEAGGPSYLVASDIRYGQIVAMDADDAAAAPSILARLEHPARLQPCSLSGDGSTEFLVADLGTYMPSDHDLGRVVLLKRAAGMPAFEEIVLASGLGRVADVRAADFDGDGRQDLVVAEFGWVHTGGVWCFRNVTPPGQALQFEPQKIDIRPGTVHAPIHDFNGDGRPDLAALVSQESESVDIFLNARQRVDAGHPRSSLFERHTVWAGPDLTFGSSSLELCDLDQDGDMDLLVTSGDSWDNRYASPTHGVHWLENRGDLSFQYHRLTYMPGAIAARACDIDLDGDRDVIAVAWMASPTKSKSLEELRPLASIVCLEQTEPGRFVHHTLERDSSFYAALETGDFDRDGDVDFAVGSGPMVAENRDEKYYLSIWWNQTLDVAD